MIQAQIDKKYVALLLLEAICKDNNLPDETLRNVLKEKEKYKEKYSVLQVGTGDSPLTIPFYEKCGFIRSHSIQNLAS